jgi:hypothetical protein
MSLNIELSLHSVQGSTVRYNNAHLDEAMVEFIAIATKHRLLQSLSDFLSSVREGLGLRLCHKSIYSFLLIISAHAEDVCMHPCM